jgi:hypothetical protein
MVETCQPDLCACATPVVPKLGGGRGGCDNLLPHVVDGPCMRLPLFVRNTCCLSDDATFHLLEALGIMCPSGAGKERKVLAANGFRLTPLLPPCRILPVFPAVDLYFQHINYRVVSARTPHPSGSRLHAAPGALCQAIYRHDTPKHIA